MNRTEMLNRVREDGKVWDLVIIGGGATGVGCAVDAASRGFSVLLLEQSDFGKGTSSRSTKLIHGGVRYLEQGNIFLVREALKERGILLKNAPHLVEKLGFIVPVYSVWEKLYYGAGLKIYNLLSGKYGFGKSRILSKSETLEHLPNVKEENLKGGILYFDGQFDDARLLIDLVKTAAGQGAAMLNYAAVFGLSKDHGIIDGVNFEDRPTGELFSVKAKAVINATGAFCDSIRRLSVENSPKIISPSQGIHLVFDKEFLPGKNSLMIPKTSDKRVLFAIPWHGKTLVGTTDTPVEKAELEPKALDEEIEFILKNCQEYLARSPKREDILSIFAGVRPLVKSSNTKNTALLSRGHTIEIDKSNLLTITGGKWTTYRRMAEDAVNQAIKIAGLPEKNCLTQDLKIDDSETEIKKLIKNNPEPAEKLGGDFSFGRPEIIWAVREEMAQNLEDILARRTRALFINAEAAVEIAPKVAEIMAQESGNDEDWIAAQIREFTKTARNYLPKTR